MRRSADYWREKRQREEVARLAAETTVRCRGCGRVVLPGESHLHRLCRREVAIAKPTAKDAAA